MYHLPNPHYKYNKAYAERFIKKLGHLSEQIRPWRKDSNEHKAVESGKYLVDSLSCPFSQVTVMLCRLHALPNVSKFPNEWIPLIDGALKGYIFDWDTLLSDNLATHILAFRKGCSISENKIPPFYMSSYIMDALCFSMDFLAMGWKWTLQYYPIHIYHDIL